MAGDRRAAADALMQRLTDAPHQFDFFTLLRRLEALRPDLPPIGRSRHAREDAVRFAQPPSLRFAPCTVEELKWERGSNIPRLMVNHFGLLGPSGPMPLHITDLARSRELHKKDATLSRFLDIFNHRMISLLYRAWALNQVTVSYQRSVGEDGPGHDTDGDSFQRYIGAFIGMTGEATRSADGAHDSAKLFFAGRLASPSRSPEGLAKLIESYFKVPVHISEFQGRWIELPAQYRCKLGSSRANSSLGGAGMCALGSRVWDCQSLVRVRLGPLSLEDYERLLPVHRFGQPGGRSFRRLAAWCKHYFGDEIDWQVQLILSKEEVPKASLGKTGRLGWTTFLHTKIAERDADGLILGPSALDDRPSESDRFDRAAASSAATPRAQVFSTQPV